MHAHKNTFNILSKYTKIRIYIISSDHIHLKYLKDLQGKGHENVNNYVLKLILFIKTKCMF